MTDMHVVMWIAIAVMFAVFMIECAYSLLKQDRHYTVWDTIMNLAIALGYTISSVTIGAMITFFLLPFYELSPLRWSMSEWWHWVVMFVINDFFFYWSHRASHKFRFMWASHAVHHNSDKLNLGTGMRNSWVGLAIDWVFFIPVVMLGFHPVLLFALIPLASGWDYLCHTPYVGRLPVLDWLFNTPSNHRMHHERAAGYHYANLGGALIIWDRLFGTYAREEKTPDYGVEPMPARPRNPFYLELYLWGSLLRDTGRWVRGVFQKRPERAAESAMVD